MPFPFVPNLRKVYVLTRWVCTRCGWFETGEIIGLHATSCPECGQSTKFVERCYAETTRALPFVSKPRKDSAPGNDSFQVSHAKGIVEKLGTDAKSRRRGGLKATGRPKKKP